MNKFYEFQIMYNVDMPSMQKIEFVHLTYDLFIHFLIHIKGEESSL